MSVNFRCFVCKQDGDRPSQSITLPCSQTTHNCGECLETKCPRSFDDSILICDDCNRQKSNLFRQNAVFLNDNQCDKELSKKIKTEKAKVNKHYDDMINLVDIRIESTLSQLNSFRNSFIDQIKYFRKKSTSQIDELCNITNIEDQYTETSHLISKFSKIQTEIENNLLLFEENSFNLEKSFLGSIYRKKINKNVFKIKNLNKILDPKTGERLNDSKHLSVLLRRDLFEYTLLLPMARKKMVHVWKSKNQSINIELINSNGISYKNVEIGDKSWYHTPIVSSYGDFFCLYIFSDSKTENIHLYDGELNCLKTKIMHRSIDSIYMNDKNIVIVNHKSNEIFEILDYNLNTIEAFGQQTEPENNFYIEILEMNDREEEVFYINRFYTKPLVFGLTDELIYFFYRNQMTIMDRKTGRIKKSDDSREPGFFILDSFSNIIKVNTFAMEISLFNNEYGIYIKNDLPKLFKQVYLTSDDYIVLYDDLRYIVHFI